MEDLPRNMEALRDKVVAGRMSRREVLRRAALAGLSAPAIATLLAACGGDDSSESEDDDQPTSAAEPRSPTTDSSSSPGETSEPAETADDTDGDEEPTPTVAVSADSAQQGGSLLAGLSSEPTSISPLIARTAFDRTAMSPFLNTLMEYDEDYNPVPLLVESAEVQEDLRTYIFKVREGVTWHDGKPLTAEDIKDTFDFFLDPETPSAAVLKRQIEGSTVTVIDEMTLSLELPAPNGALLDGLTAMMVVRRDFDEANPIGTGPFKFVEWIRNQQLVYERNEDYFVPDLPYLDELTLRPAPDQNQLVNLLVTGEVDTIDQVGLPLMATVEESANASVIRLDPSENLPFYLFMMNNVLEPFTITEVRQAINWAIDRQALSDATFGVSQVRSNQVPESHWAYNPDAPLYLERDLEQARALMEQAGLADGFSTVLSYHLLADEFEQFAQIIQSNLAEINIEVELQLLEVGLWVDEVLRQNTFEMAMTWNVPGWDPEQLLGGWTRSDGASMQWAKTEEFEALMTQGVSVVDLEERKPFYDEAQMLVFTDVPGAVINEKVTMVAANNRVKGFTAQLRGHTEYHRVWIDE